MIVRYVSVKKWTFYVLALFCMRLRHFTELLLISSACMTGYQASYYRTVQPQRPDHRKTLLSNSVHKGRIFADNEIASRPIIRILLNVQSLPYRDSHSPIGKLAAAVWFLKYENFLGVC
jgi:hypothetical protein